MTVRRVPVMRHCDACGKLHAGECAPICSGCSAVGAPMGDEDLCVACERQIAEQAERQREEDRNKAALAAWRALLSQDGHLSAHRRQSIGAIVLQMHRDGMTVPLPPKSIDQLSYALEQGGAGSRLPAATASWPSGDLIQYLRIADPDNNGSDSLADIARFNNMHSTAQVTFRINTGSRTNSIRFG